MSWLGSEWDELTLTAKDLLMQFSKALENDGIILLDGAIGTELDKRGRTMMGDSAEKCAKSLTDAGADVVGANCGDLDPAQMAVVVSLLKSATTLPVLAQPNAGRPKLVGNKTIFEMAPAPFAAGIAECLHAGARLVGGCCGTSPEHIRAVTDILDQK
jgi:5-methyltetrahydrofolate--homocysteine methyltransferase